MQISKRNIMLKRNNRGFTIIELMIATAVLSTILLMITVVMMNIGKLYYKGINQSRTQNDVRSIIADVSDSLKLSDMTPQADVPIPGNIAHALCVGTVRYSYVIGVHIGQVAPGGGTTTYQHVLWRDTITPSGTCSPVDLTIATPTSGGAELVAPNSRLTAFSISSPSPYNVTVGVAYGDDDLLCSPSVVNSCSTPAVMSSYNDFTKGDLLCKGGIGDQFCSTALLSTTVVQRLTNNSF